MGFQFENPQMPSIQVKSHEAEYQQAQSRQEQRVPNELKESQNLDAPAPPFASNYTYHYLQHDIDDQGKHLRPVHSNTPTRHSSAHR